MARGAGPLPGSLMPSKSKKQERTMRAAAHDPAFAKKMGIPQGVAREFVQADAGRRVARATRVAFKPKAR